MVTKVTDSVLDLSDLNQPIDTGGNPVRGLPLIPTTADEAVAKDYLDLQLAAAISALQAIVSPPGLGPLQWPTATPPTGWLICDGSIQLIATYPALAAELGTTYGGDGITTFGLPDMRGRFPLGRNTSGSGSLRVNRTAAQNIGGIDGEEFHTLITAELAAHVHSGSTSSDGSHAHTGSTNVTGDHNHTTTASNSSQNQGSSSANHVLYQPGTPTSTNGAHSHTLNINAAGLHSHSFTTDNTGSDQAHENTPPFLTVNYIIKT